MDALIALTALTAMEIVLGIDNIIFIAILAGRLPKHQQALARTLGLAAAMGTRILLLLALTWILNLEETKPAFKLTSLGVPESWVIGNETSDAEETCQECNQPITTDEHAQEEGHGEGDESEAGWFTTEVNNVSWRDLILFFGGLFLVGKSVHEVHEKFEGGDHAEESKKTASFSAVLIQIAILDIVFSLDSVITAVGMAKELWVMITAVVLAVGVMLICAGTISRFVDRHPTLKMLALSFLILIGVMLIAEGIGTEVNKGYIYFAMAFALIVEFLNLRLRGRIMPSSPTGHPEAV